MFGSSNPEVQHAKSHCEVTSQVSTEAKGDARTKERGFGFGTLYCQTIEKDLSCAPEHVEAKYSLSLTRLELLTSTNKIEECK